MRGLLVRTGSVSVLHHSFVPGSPRASLSSAASQSFSLHLEVGRRKDSPPPTGIRRSSSEPDVIRFENGFSRLSGVGSRSFPAVVPEEVCVPGGFDRRNYADDWTESRIPGEELGFPGGGIGIGQYSGSGGGGGDDWRAGSCTGGEADWSKIGAYYQEMLKSDPTNSLLLRNYGRFLHEVEGDMAKAEEYYGRAILASPGDGDVLASYGKLIWETQRDEDRAKSYFDQAVHSSPDDCMVLGSYAQFMWEAEEGDEEEGGDHSGWERENDQSAAMVFRRKWILTENSGARACQNRNGFKM